MIIEHTLPDGTSIFSMYAHLDPDKILVSKDDPVTKGQVIATGQSHKCQWIRRLVAYLITPICTGRCATSSMAGNQGRAPIQKTVCYRAGTGLLL